MSPPHPLEPFVMAIFAQRQFLTPCMLADGLRGRKSMSNQHDGTPQWQWNHTREYAYVLVADQVLIQMVDRGVLKRHGAGFFKLSEQDK